MTSPVGVTQVATFCVTAAHTERGRNRTPLLLTDPAINGGGAESVLVCTS